MNRKVALRALAGIAVSVVAILLVAQAADIPSALGSVAAVDPGALVLPALVVVVQLLIRTVRWSGLLTAMAGVPIGPRSVLGPLAAGYLGNIVLPARLGEVVRIVLVSRRTEASATAATASVVVERAVDLLALLSIATVASALIGATGWLPLAGVLALLVVLGLAMRAGDWLAAHLPAFLPPRVRDVLARLATSLGAARPAVLGRAWILSLAAWSLDALVIWLCAQALGIPVAPGVAALIAAGAAVGSAIPAAAGYLGTYELGAIAMAGFAGVPAGQALQIALLGHAMAVVPLAVIGLVALVAMAVTPVRRAAAEPAAAEPAAVEPARGAA